MKSVRLALAALPLLGLSGIASAGVTHPVTATILAPPLLLRVSEDWERLRLMRPVWFLPKSHLKTCSDYSMPICVTDLNLQLGRAEF